MLFDNQPIYVIDTNVLVDYPDIIPEPGGSAPVLEEPTVDLSNANLVVPTAVVRELSGFKNEASGRGRVARVVSRRLRDIMEGKINTIEDIYNLRAPVCGVAGTTSISILPVHKNFKQCLPFSPSEEDMDGQSILAAIATQFLVNNIPIDGTAREVSVMKFSNARQVTLLTNDNGLAIRARARGIYTQRYGYKYPAPYTGRRDVYVTKELFDFFYEGVPIDRDFWESSLPDQPKLVANEFVILRLADPAMYPADYAPRFDPFFRHIGRYDVEKDAIVHLSYVSEFPSHLENDGQAIYAEALMNPAFAAVICTGPAGSGKTYMPTIYGCEACRNGTYMGVAVIPCESRSKIGALPGDMNEKMDPDVKPLKHACAITCWKTITALRAHCVSTNKTVHPHLRLVSERADGSMITT